jgi:hypothetical protein
LLRGLSRWAMMGWTRAITIYHLAQRSGIVMR